MPNSAAVLLTAWHWRRGSAPIRRARRQPREFRRARTRRGSGRWECGRSTYARSLDLEWRPQLDYYIDAVAALMWFPVHF